MFLNLNNTLRLAIFFFLLSFGLAADSPNFVNANKLAGGKLASGGIYAFKYGSLTKGAGLGHVRLLVLWIEGSPGSLEVKTTNFDQVQLKSTGIARYFGAPCIANVADLAWNYDVSKKSEYKFLGPVKPNTSKQDVADVAAQVHEGKETYNLITNNCNQFVKKIFQRIKARDLMKRALLHEEELFSMGSSDLSSRDLISMVMMKRRALDDLEDELHARAEETLYRRSLYLNGDDLIGDENDY